MRINDPSDLEIITPVESKDHPGFYYYPEDNQLIVSKEGIVINIKTNKILNPYLHKLKHLNINYSKVIKNEIKHYSKKLHRILAITFIGRPSRHINKPYSKLEVNHINAIRFDYSLDNLEWCTCKENINHYHNNNFCNKDQSILAKNIITNEIKEFNSIEACANYFIINKSTLWKHLKNGLSGLYHKDFYIFKYNDNSQWKQYPINRMKEIGFGNSSIDISVEDINNKTIIIVSGIDKVAKLINLAYKTIWNKFKYAPEFKFNQYIIKKL